MVRQTATIAVALGVLLVSARAAEAQYFGRNKVHYQRLDFRLLQTEHFDIHYYTEEEAAARQAARMAERWYWRFSRVLGHTFARRQPLVLYASHPHFSQTNLSPGSPGEGVGGFTERIKSRIAMPFAAGLGETDHVLGHEIAHAFQIDIAKSVKRDAFALPGWFIEGMAEYLSVGHADAHTLMWVRDAASQHRLPTFKQLGNPAYFPYRYGHALWSYLAMRYGDDVMGRALRSRARGDAVKRIEEATGESEADLTRAWHESIGPRPPDTIVGGVAAVVDERKPRMQLAPALSPDGRFLTFLSERDRTSLGLFMADTDRRKVVRKLLSTASDPHFESLQYIHSAGAWDRDGRRFAMTALSGGHPLLVLLDIGGSGTRTEVRIDGVSELYNPTWSPDGTRLVFSGLKGGLSDLFMYVIATKTLTQLTADAFADLQPAWSPDGVHIAFASDRFTSDLDALRFGPLHVALLDLRSGRIDALLPSSTTAKQISPQWTPGGDAIYFVSDLSGTSDVYLTVLGTGRLQQVTQVDGGVSGITATSPSLAVASRSGTIGFSVFRDGRYQIELMDGEIARATARVVSTERDDRPVVSAAAPLPAPQEGLPAATTFTDRSYDDRLQLESVAQPFVGATTGNGFGGALQASVGVTFGDLLRDRQLQTLVRLGTDVDDLAAQVSYSNRKGQWNWGVSAGFIPARFYDARRAVSRDGELLVRETTHLRYVHQWGRMVARYNVNRSRRFELGAGVRRTGFTWQTVTRINDTTDDRLVDRALDESPAGRPIYLAEAQAAFVHDTAVFGATSPVAGQRLRIEVEPAVGALTFADLRIDARRYFMPAGPVTIATRAEYVGRFGPGARDARLTPLVVGLQSLVRGYDLRSFAAGECGRAATRCSLMDELTGSRFALFSVELRAPLVGIFTGELDYGPLPVEAIAFVDSGFLSTRHPTGVDHDRFRSVGLGARASLGGMVMEMTAARPFDRVGNGWTMSLLLRPGW